MPTISISFLDHVLFPHAEGYHLQFRLLEKSLHFALTDDIGFHILELQKFIKKDNDLSSGLDKWLYFLRHAAMMEVGSLPAMMQQPLFLRAIEELKMLNQTDLERERYESRRKAILDENTRMRSARREGLKEGREEGIKEGIKEGFAKGRQIGVIHVCERLLHRTETPAEQLAQLSLEELNRLADELQASILPK